MYFVIWSGNLVNDPWNTGVDSFEYEVEAYAYSERMRSKGFKTKIYYGALIDSST